MIAGLRTHQIVVLGAVLGSGLAGSLVALGHRGADAQFIQDQRHPPNLRAPDVERVVRTAPDPSTGKGSGVAATCTKRGSGPLGNPWSCVVRYPSRKPAKLTVRVSNDGNYVGRYAGGGVSRGCCIDLPGTSG